MKILIILSIALLTSCGMRSPFDKVDMAPSDPRQFTTSNPVFDTFRNLFYDNYYHYNNSEIPRSTIINFGDVTRHGESVIGVCYSWSNGVNEIIIKKTWWDSTLEMNRRILIDHELGHCALNLGHNDEKFSYKKYSVSGDTLKETTMNVPLSIMNTYHIGNNANIDNIELYAERLFTQDKTAVLNYYEEIESDNLEIKESWEE